jgi:O-antigen/teichoic acid export membrane protein
VPLVPASVSIVATGWMDRLAIASSLPLADLGQYAVAVRVGAVVGLLIAAFQAAMTPLAYTYHRDPATPRAFARAGRLYAGLALLLLAGLAWIGPELIRTLVSDRYAAAAPLLPVVAAIPLLAGFAYLAPGLALLRATRQMALIAIASAGLTTALNFTLVPRFGIVAAAWSSAIGAASALGLTVVYGQTRYRIPWERGSLFVVLITGIAVGVSTQFLYASGVTSLYVRTLLFLAVVTVVGAARVIELRDVQAAWAKLDWRSKRKRDEQLR